MKTPNSRFSQDDFASASTKVPTGYQSKLRTMTLAFIAVVLLALGAGLWSAGSGAPRAFVTAAQAPRDLSTPEHLSISNSPTVKYSASDLCGKLHLLKYAPYDPKKKSGDPIYDGLMNKGRETVPCLIERITDLTPMTDPWSAPAIQNFRAGDAAVFMLLIVTGQEWTPEKMFSPKYAKKWKTDGVYAYKSYIEEPGNRIKMQRWWKRWFAQHANSPGKKF